VLGLDGEDDLGYGTIAEASHQLFDLELHPGRCIGGRDNTVEHMVHSAVLPGAFQGKDIGRLFHDADFAMVAC